MPVLDLPGLYVDDVDVPLSAADLNQLIDAAVLLDGLTWRRLSACCSSGNQRAGAAADWHPRGDYRQSWWGGYYRTGMDTLTIEGETDAHDLDVYIDGAPHTTISGGSTFSEDIALTGYGDGDVVLVEFRTNGNPATAPGGYSTLYRIDDIYMSPIVVTSAWGGVPTFSGTYNAARFNQLLDAIRYVWDRVIAVPIFPVLGGIYLPASHKQETIRLFDGSVGRYQSGEVLRVGGLWVNRTNAEHLEIEVDGVVTSLGPLSEGQTLTFYEDIALTHTLGTRASVAIRAVIENDVYRHIPGVFSSYSLQTIRSEAGAGGYPVQSIPTRFTAGESISDSTLNSRLTGISSVVSGCKARLDARPEVWNRSRLTRRVYAGDDTQVARNVKRYAASFVRQGDKLMVRGKGVKVGFGAISFKPPEKEDEPINYSDFTFAREESVGTSEDKVETSTVYLDQIAGLEPGMRYYVWGAGNGSTEYVGEFLV